MKGSTLLLTVPPVLFLGAIVWKLTLAEPVKSPSVHPSESVATRHDLESTCSDEAGTSGSSPELKTGGSAS
jgi:hypothetical protein